MEDILLLQAIERYLDGTMLPAEKAYFEQLRKNTPEIDQMVVEHNMFLHQMDMFAVNKNLRNSLHEVHTRLVEKGDVYEGGEISTKGKVVQLYNKYKRVTAIAASVGGAIALAMSIMVAVLSPAPKKEDLQELSKKVYVLEGKLNADINNKPSKRPEGATLKSGGTGFLIDAKGYIITNAHVLKGSTYVNVTSNKGDAFNAKIAYVDVQKDLAILKIEDDDYIAFKSLPYSISKSDIRLGEEVFTLGYPRNDITYSKGDISAKTGYNGDTSSFQIQIPANPGNSGGPLLNKNGEVVGVLSTREIEAEGVTFAIKSKNIHRLIDQLKDSDTGMQKINMPQHSNLKGMDREAQINKIQDCVYMVQAFNRK
jgi:S1-C subfamily serine protease